MILFGGCSTGRRTTILFFFSERYTGASRQVEPSSQIGPGAGPRMCWDEQDLNTVEAHSLVEGNSEEERNREAGSALF